MYFPIWQLCVLALALVALAVVLMRWYDVQILRREDNLVRLLEAAQVVDDALGDLHGDYASPAVGVAHGCLQAAIAEAERHLVPGERTRCVSS